MKSAIGRKVQGRPRNAVPVSQGSSGFYGLSGFLSGNNPIETFLRAYGANGTTYQSVSLLASSTARVEWNLYRGEKRDGRRRYTTRDEGSDQRVQVVQHAALDTLNHPNPFMTRNFMFELSQMYLDLAGKAPWVLGYASARGVTSTFPTEVWPVRPDRIQPVPDRDRVLAGWVYTSPDGQEKVPLAVNEVVMCRYPDPLDPYYGGLGPTQSVLVDIDAARYSAEWNRDFFLNSAVPGGVVQTPNELSDEEFDQLSSRWREAHLGVQKAHRVAFLENGATWQATGISQKDMDFANLRNTSRDMIREAFGIHKVMLGVSDDVNRANAQTGEEVFESWKVVPRLDRWRDTLNHQFLPLFGSTGTGVEFDYVTPVPANREQDNQELTAKANAALLLVQAGYDAQAVAEAVGLPDMPLAQVQAIAAQSGGSAGDAAGSADAQSAVPGESEAQDMTSLLRKVLQNGYVPVEMGAR